MTIREEIEQLKKEKNAVILAHDYVRQEVCKYLGYLGVDFDFEVNTGLRGKEAELTKEGSKVKVFVIPTNEELAIARETLALVK